MDATTRVECGSCGKRLAVRAELAGKKVKCPGCGAAVIVAAPPPALEPTAYWFFQWGDVTDIKKKKAFFVLGEDALLTVPLEGKAAKRAEEALQAGTPPEKALSGQVSTIPYVEFVEVRTNEHHANLIVDYRSGDGLASGDFNFVERDTRDEVFAELCRRLEGWKQTRETYSRLRATVEPLIAMGAVAAFAAVAVGLAVLWQDRPSDNAFVGMIRLLGPLGWAGVGAAAILGLAVWMAVRMRTPPIMLYLRPPVGADEADD